MNAKAKEIMEDIKRLTKEYAEKEGVFMPFFFLFREDKMVTEPLPIMAVQGCDSRDSNGINFFKIGMMAKMLGADMVVALTDVAYRSVNKKEAVDATEQPLSYPKSMRKEGMCFHFVEIPSWKMTISLTPYSGGDGETIAFEPEMDIGESSGLESRFIDLIRDGYSKDIPTLPTAA